MTKDRTANELVQDPTIRKALAIIAGRNHTTTPSRLTGDICTGCGGPAAPDGDICIDCQRRRRRRELDKRTDHHHRQKDYAWLRTNYGATDGAARWLLHQLRNGATVNSRTIRHRARGAGINSRTLRRAREQLQRQEDLFIIHGWDDDTSTHATKWTRRRPKESDRTHPERSPSSNPVQPNPTINNP